MGSAFFTALTMASVEALPLRVMVIRTPRDPLVRTMLFCTLEAVVHLRHVLDVDGRAVHGLDRQVVQVVAGATGLLLTLT